MRLPLAIALCALTVVARAGASSVASFTENKGQWPEQVLYRSLFPGGALFVEKTGLTYLLVQGGMLDHHAMPGEHAGVPLHGHAYHVSFTDGTEGVGQGTFAQQGYENFFLGNEPSKWGTRCSVFAEVWVRGVWPGVDLHISGRDGLKYEFVVAPGVDPLIVQLQYSGQNTLDLANGRLRVGTTAGTVNEEAPLVFQGAEHALINSAYRLHSDHVSFRLDGKWDRTQALTIDPTLTFGSYIGSAANNFGFTATYDHDGALYGGGIAFGFGYPATLGAWQGTYAGGDNDIGISKWTPDGSILEWSTYIGGNGSETPHSLVVNGNNELFLLAVTGSSTYPTTSGCFDASFNGGVEIPLSGGWVNMAGGEGYGHPDGTDIAITHFSSDATALLGSTFIGGSGNDGVNNSVQLAYNYGDHFRGEIALDANERPVVATSTQSQDAPTTPGAPQTTFGGGAQDAYLFRMDATLGSLQFATYYGGSQDDSGYGVQFASTGDVYMTGGTGSPDLPMAGTPYDASYNGGVDGYIARFSSGGNALLGSTFLGKAGEDQSYFVQLNSDDEVFVVGQTHGAYPVTAGKYCNPGSSQFIHKFTGDLSTSLWSTRIGNGNGTEDISPSAFLVSDCGQIYFSGWGGSVNTNVLATSSTTFGLPITADAFQSTTDGSDCYLMVLDAEAAALNYATYFGGALSPEHVDGGTSRFDKNGNVYQAVCAGCWNNSDFPTTPDAWSNTNNGGPGACNLAVFKFNLNHPTAQIDIDGPNYVCLPNATVNFQNLSTGGNTFAWDFGDDQGSALFEPQHVYDGAGVYTVQMVLSDDDPCTANDTTHITLEVVDPLDASVDPVQQICRGQQVQLHAHGGYAFHWLSAQGITDLSIADPIVEPNDSTVYYVVVTDSCGTDTAHVLVPVTQPFGDAGADTTLCAGSTLQLHAVGGGTYLWSPATPLNDPTLQMPTVSVADTTLFHVQVTTPLGCVVVDSMTVNVQFNLPERQLQDTAVCTNGSVQLEAGAADTYAWRTAPGITQLGIADPVVSPPHDLYYAVLLRNACGTVWDSAFVDVREVNADAWPDTLICPGGTLTLHANGGTSYAWSPGGSAGNALSDSLMIAPSTDTQYRVVVSNSLGCADTAFADVTVLPEPSVFAGGDHIIDIGDAVQLSAYGDGSLVWSPDSSLTCDSCAAPFASPDHTTLYTVQITDANGCKALDQLIVYVNGSLFVPNTFTPNNDGINDGFFARATEVKAFQLYVFNRWGEQIFATNDVHMFWDGTFKGTPSPIDTYVWRVDMTENSGRKREVYGHVTLLR